VALDADVGHVAVEHALDRGRGCRGFAKRVFLTWVERVRGQRKARAAAAGSRVLRENLLGDLGAKRTRERDVGFGSRDDDELRETASASPSVPFAGTTRFLIVRMY
jgi:hypothetical protein